MFSGPLLGSLQLWETELTIWREMATGCRLLQDSLSGCKATADHELVLQTNTGSEAARITVTPLLLYVLSVQGEEGVCSGCGQMLGTG